jgi:hypothetical protein
MPNSNVVAAAAAAAATDDRWDWLRAGRERSTKRKTALQPCPWRPPGTQASSSGNLDFFWYCMRRRGGKRGSPFNWFLLDCAPFIQILYVYVNPACAHDLRRFGAVVWSRTFRKRLSQNTIAKWFHFGPFPEGSQNACVLFGAVNAHNARFFESDKNLSREIHFLIALFLWSNWAYLECLGAKRLLRG